MSLSVLQTGAVCGGAASLSCAGSAGHSQSQAGRLAPVWVPARTPALSLHAVQRPMRSVPARVAVNEVELKSVEDAAEEAEESAFQPTEAGPDPPSPFEIQSLLMELCDETSVAELKIKVGSFSLHVKRSVQGKVSHAPHFFPPPVPSFPMADTLAAVGAASSAPPPPPPPAAEEVDEGLLYVNSPTVGILRRGRIYKGKRGKNLVDVGAELKKGQVVFYIEQLGTQVAVETEHFGEVVSIFADDGDAVGFGDPLIAIRPGFPGIKKLA